MASNWAHGVAPKDGVTERLGGFATRALDQGFERVQVDREAPGRTVLRCGYQGARGSLALELDELKLAGPIGEVVGYFGEVIRRIGNEATPELPIAVDPAWLDGQPIETMAREYLALRVVVDQAEALKERLLARMQAEGKAAVAVAGIGAVVLQPGKPQRRVDGAAVKALFEELAGKLRARGEELPTPEVPRKLTDASDGLRVVWSQ